MMDTKEVLLQWFLKFLIKETSGGIVKKENMSTKELAKELQKTINRKFEGAELTDL